MNPVVLQILMAAPAVVSQPTPIPTGFVDITTLLPKVILDVRYATENNFVGTRIDGYESPRCYLTRQAATALSKAYKELQIQGHRLRIYDCYRPQRAVNHFIRWAKDLSDQKMKKVYYPNEVKETLFDKGYIASRSGHSRGSTLDLTIEGLDMGTAWDYFGDASHTAYPQITPKQQANRRLLLDLMAKHGFKNYSKEWWHFTLKNEPFPKTYFDFAIR